MALHLHKAGRDVPPRLSFALPTRADIPGTLYPWTDVQLPVDIVLLTVEECEFLACYAYLKNAFRSYHRELGFVYFGTIGESGEDALKVGLVRSYRGSSAPGGSLTTVKATVVHLRPKAAFSVGSCMGLDPEVTKLGDVVASSKLVTAELTAAGKIGKPNQYYFLRVESTINRSSISRSSSTHLGKYIQWQFRLRLCPPTAAAYA